MERGGGFQALHLLVRDTEVDEAATDLIHVGILAAGSMQGLGTRGS
jgi:hypothetical protein